MEEKLLNCQKNDVQIELDSMKAVVKSYESKQNKQIIENEEIILNIKNKESLIQELEMKLFDSQKQFEDATLYYDDLKLDFSDKSNKFDILENENNQLI